jgi:hypothetical protein
MRITPTGTIVPVPIPGAVPTQESIVTDIHGSGPNDLWIALGASGPGGILHSDGTNFIPPAGLPGTDFGAGIDRVWAYSPTNVWVTFSSGPRPVPFYRYDGTAWLPADASTPGVDVFFVRGGLVTGALNNSFAFDPAHFLWAYGVGKFLRTQ